MRVAYIQDLNPFLHGGGAQATDQEIVKEAFRRGYDVDLITPENFHEPQCDLVIFSNCHALMYNMGSNMLKIAEKAPYVCFHHDYFCKYRLFYPMEEKCKSCVYLGPWRKLYHNSVLNIFMSPLHREGFLYVMPELEKYPYALVPSCINPKDYECKEVIDPKENQVCGVNVLLDFKGKNNIVKYVQQHPELSFIFAGGVEGEVLLPHNAKYVGPKSREELVKLYAESEYLIHLPSSSPFDRIPVEFLIANPKGKLITNRNVGSLSYEGVVENGKLNRQELIRLVSTAPQTFWNEVEAHVA